MRTVDLEVSLSLVKNNSLVLSYWLGGLQQNPTITSPLFAYPVILTHRLSTTSFPNDRSVQSIHIITKSTTSSPHSPCLSPLKSRDYQSLDSSHQISLMPMMLQLWGRAKTSSLFCLLLMLHPICVDVFQTCFIAPSTS